MKSKHFGIICSIILVYTFFPFIPTLADESENIQQLYNTADVLYSQANYAGAIAKYVEALEESKKPGVRTEMIDKDFNTLVNFRIAVSYSRLAEQTGNNDHYNSAIKHINIVAPTAKIPKHQQALTYLLGHTLFRTKQYELAEEQFMKLIVDFPDSLQVEHAWYAIGQLNYKLGDFEKTRSAFSNLIVKYPKSNFKDDAQLLIAQTFLDEHNYDAAYKEFEKINTPAFKQYPDKQAEAMYKAAFSLYKLAKYDDAIRRYTDFIKQYTNHITTHSLITAAYFDLGKIYTEQSDFDRARINYKNALNSTSDKELQSEIHTEIGHSFFKQTDYVNAISTYSVVIELYPDSNFVADAKLGIADSHFRLENWNKATAAFKDVIEYITNDFKFSNTTEHVYIPYSSYLVAEAYFKLGTQQKEISQVELATESFKQALTWYQNTVANFPKNKIAPHAIFGEIWSLNELGRYKDLEKTANKYIEKYQNNPEFDLFVAEVQLQLADIMRMEYKQYVQAAREYAKISNYPSHPKFHFVKLMAKIFEGKCYFEASKSVDYTEGDPPSKLNSDYLKKSIVAFQELNKVFADESFLPGVTEGLYNDFPERVPQVESALMNEALSHEMLGNLDAARKCYTSIPETSKSYQKARFQLKRLQEIENVSDN